MQENYVFTSSTQRSYSALFTGAGRSVVVYSCNGNVHPVPTGGFIFVARAIIWGRRMRGEDAHWHWIIIIARY